MRHEAANEEPQEDVLIDETGEHQPTRVTLAMLSMSQAPWWFVSLAFHGLGILLLTLITFSACQVVENEIIITTKLERNYQLLKDDEKELPKSNSPLTLASDHDTLATDPLSKDPSDIVIPPEILAQARLGEDWQTVNLDKPDKKSAFGNPESRFFYSMTGNDEPAGGGGTNGTQLDEVIGLGNGTPGTGGGFGGGDGTGLGIGKGKGSGSYGRGDGAGREWVVKRHGGSTGVNGTEGSVSRALAWLSAHQEQDGHWDTQKFESNEKTDTAITGMALLAFLGAGHTEKIGKYNNTVRRAVAWLKSRQQANGLVFDGTDAGAHRGTGYPHAIAGMALAEAAGMGRVPDTMMAAQRAVDYSTKLHQSGEGYDSLGFRYNAKQAGDLSVTGWYVMQLKAARVAGLKVDHSNFEGVIRFLDSVERKGAGGDKGYGPISVYGYQPGDAHEQSAHRLTIIGNLCRQFLGWKKDDLRSSVEWAVEKGGLPDGWGEGKTDLYYWYYGTFCTFQQYDETWQKWNAAMKKTFIENQRKDGDENGSWDPVGDYSKEWGRVGQTALACMCLEVYYRYALISK